MYKKPDTCLPLPLLLTDIPCERPYSFLAQIKFAQQLTQLTINQSSEFMHERKCMHARAATIDIVCKNHRYHTLNQIKSNRFILPYFHVNLQIYIM